MDLKELTDEEYNAMELASSRANNGKNAYDALLTAVKGGKKMLVKLGEGHALKNLKWGISQAAKKAGINIVIRALADNSGVVVSCPDAAQPPQSETGDSNPETPASDNVGNKSRK